MNRRSMAGDYGLIVVGTFLIGFTIKGICDPANTVTGGVSGLATIAKELWSVSLWLTNTLLNIPLFAAGLYIMGWKFIKHTLFPTVMLSVSLCVLPEASHMGNDIPLSTLLGDIINDVRTGTVFLASCTTGGTDILAALMQKQMKHYTLAQIIQVLGGIIALAGTTVFGIPTALYALITTFYVPEVTSGLIEDFKFSEQAYIISDNYREIADMILEWMGRRVTNLEAREAYPSEEKKILLCAVSKKEIVRIREIMSRFDTRAFVIMSDAGEIFGEGFIEY